MIKVPATMSVGAGAEIPITHRQGPASRYRNQLSIFTQVNINHLSVKNEVCKYIFKKLEINVQIRANNRSDAFKRNKRSDRASPFARAHSKAKTFH